jgi:hypothetical protein
MSTSVALLTTRAGQELGDESETRWAAARKIDYANQGKNAIYAENPECACLEGVSTVPTAIPSNMASGGSVTIADRFVPALIHYICWRCFGEDTDDERNVASAQYHERMYKEALP